MKILFVNQYCGQHGGVEQNLADLADGLRERGHRCFLAYQKQAGHDAQQYAERFEVAVQCLNTHGKGKTDEGLEKLVSLKPDVVFVHKLESVAPIVNRFSTCRLVRMVHDHDLCCPRHHKYFAWNHHVCRQAAGWRCWFDLAFIGRNQEGVRRLRTGFLRNIRRELKCHHWFDRLLVAGEFMRDELIQNGLSSKRIEMVPPVVRVPSVEPTPPSREPKILFVGQMIRGKGVHLLVESLRRLKVPFRAELIGDGVWRDYIEQLLVRHELDDRVKVLGWKSQEELVRAYQDSRVVVVPSLWPEPFGMVGLEAMHHARPVVAFDVGGIREWLDDGHTGRLVPAADTMAFARALTPFLTDSDYAAQLGCEGYRQVRSRFSFDAYLDRIEAILTGEPPRAEGQGPEIPAREPAMALTGGQKRESE